MDHVEKGSLARVRAEIRSFDWSDLETTTSADYLPTRLVLAIGPAGGPGADLFSLTVTTTEAFAGEVRAAGVLPGRHHLFVDDFSRPRVEAFLRKQVSTLDAPGWPEMVALLIRLAAWEFEDYRP